MLRLALLSLFMLLAWSSTTTFAQGFIATSIGPNIPQTNGYLGNGISAIDFNNDGWDDLTLCTNGNGILFFQNNQGNGFTPLSNPLGQLTEDVKMASWVDYDNDGDLDLFFTVLNEPFRLFERTGSWNFEEVTNAAGLEETYVQTYGHSWGDPDKDGDLDLYICNYDYFDGVITNYFYANNGDGTFENISDQTVASDSSNFSFQSVFVDFNLDGWEDLFVINDRLFSVNNLYKNNEGEWQKVSENSGLDTNIFSMSNSWADFDRDGDLDVYISNNPTGNLLERNDGEGIFTDITLESGASIMDMSWSATWIDYDNDGWEDLHVNCQPFWGQPGFDRLLKNVGGSFVEASSDGFSLVNGDSYSSAYGDFNNDGFPDLVVNHGSPGTAHLYMNEGIGGNYVKIKCDGIVSNPRGIGCVITLYTDDGQQMRYRHAGESYLSQHSEWEIFGLGSSSTIDSISIRWPSGIVDRFYDLDVNQSLVISEGQSFSATLNIESEEIYFCDGDSILLHLLDAEVISWNNGSTEDEIYVDEPGFYQATAIGPLGVPIISNTVMVDYAPQPEPVHLIDHVSCYNGLDGSVTVFSENEVDIFAFELNNEWYDNGINDLPAGIYPINYQSEFGCIYQDTLEILQPEPITALFEIEAPACYNNGVGSVEVTASGGVGPYTTNWFEAEPGAITSGQYPVQITDAHSCSHDTLVVIPDIVALEVQLEFTNIDMNGGGSAWVEIINGTAPFNIQWSTGENSETISDLDAGAYAVNVTDANSCIWSGTILITNILEVGSKTFDLYPNPASDYIVVEGVSQSIAIFDNRGRKIISVAAPIDQNLRLDVSSLSPGLYVLKTGEISRRFIKYEP